MTRGAGGGRPAKPVAQRRNRSKPTHDVVTLPKAARKGAPPKSPVPLDDKSEPVYRALWATQEASQWTKGTALAVAELAELASSDDLSKGDREEMRHLMDRLGLHPHARRQLRWALPDEDAESARPQSSGSVTRLRAVDPGDAAAG